MVCHPLHSALRKEEGVLSQVLILCSYQSKVDRQNWVPSSLPFNSFRFKNRPRCRCWRPRRGGSGRTTSPLSPLLSLPMVAKPRALDEHSRHHLLSILLDPSLLRQSLSAPARPTAAQVWSSYFYNTFAIMILLKAVTLQARGSSPTLPRRSHGDLAFLVQMLSPRALQEVAWLQRSTITTLLEERRWRTWASSSPS